MQSDELAALRKQADAIHAGDVHLGRFLHDLINYIARLDTGAETSPKLKAVAKEGKEHAN